MRLFLQSFRANLTEEQILSMVDPVELASIKQLDPHPYFQAFSICHEGESRPHVLNGKTKPIRWFKAAVQSLKKLALKGLNFFRGHNADSSTEGRESLGRVVGNGEIDVDGNLNHVTIAYHPPAVREEAKKFDVCSMEAFWDLVDNGKEYIARAAEKITGIALGNSDNESPAFPGAVKLGMVQAFDPGDGDKQGAAEGSPQNKGSEKMTLAEVKQFIADNGIPVWKIYNQDQVFEDKAVQKIIEERDKLKEVADGKDSKITELEKTINETSRAQRLATLDNRVAEIIGQPDRNITAEQKAFINKKLSAAKKDFTDADITEDGLAKFVNSAVNDYKLFVSIDKTPPGSPPDAGDQKPDGKDFTKAENNELLEEDL